MDKTRSAWRWRISHGQGFTGPGLIQVQKLAGVRVRCPKCGQAACVPYRQELGLTVGYRYYMKCRSCHKKTVTSQRALTELVREQSPGIYKEILNFR
jgi:ribosomal protein S27E